MVLYETECSHSTSSYLKHDVHIALGLLIDFYKVDDLCVAMTTLLVPVVFLSESNIAISDCLRGNSWSYMKQNVHTALALI